MTHYVRDGLPPLAEKNIYIHRLFFCFNYFPSSTETQLRDESEKFKEITSALTNNPKENGVESSFDLALLIHIHLRLPDFDSVFPSIDFVLYELPSTCLFSFTFIRW